MRVRHLLLITGILYLSSLLFPYWIFIMYAPTYPEKGLAIALYADRLEGDIEEWGRVSRLVGIKVPPPIPELDYRLIPLLMLGLASLSALSYFRGAWVRPSVLASWAALIALMAWTQYRLHLLGHDLDPRAPLRNYVEPFTPPLVGWITVGGRITVYHWPHLGSFLFLLGIILATLAARTRLRKEEGGGDGGEA